MTTDTSTPANGLRQLAIERLHKRRALYTHALAFVAVNLFLTVIWLLTGGFFWPAIPMFGWAIGLALHAWDVHSPELPTERAINREVDRLAHR